MKKFLLFLMCFILSSMSCFATVKFTDVAENYWGAEVIYKLADKGVINGYEDGTYKPLNSVTYGEFIKLVMATVLPSDFEPSSITSEFDHWSAPYVKLAEIYGIIDDEFITIKNVNNKISRIEMACIISMADMILNDVDFDSSKSLNFNDIFSVVGKERTLLLHAYSRGFVVGNPDGSYRPSDEMNRAEAATIIDRFISIGGKS